MKALGHYSIIALLILVVLVGVLWPFFDAAGRSSLLVAAAIALPIQVGAFALIVPAFGHGTKFLLRWGLGMLGRMGVVAAIGLSLHRFEDLDPSVLLLGVCGFLFTLLMLEPMFFRSQGSTEFAR
jgi:CDP-diglyceride synthetase